MSIFPFSCVLKTENVDEFNPGRDSFPCKICRKECLNDCIQCDLCDKWLHFECTRLPLNTLLELGKSDRKYYCSRRCEMLLLPFASSNEFLFNEGLIDISTSNPIFSSKNTVSSSSSKSSTEANRRQKYLNKTVYFDPFLDIKCSYLSGKNVKTSHLSNSEDELTIFHNNIRSLNQENFSKAEDLFINCNSMRPDIMLQIICTMCKAVDATF